MSRTFQLTVALEFRPRKMDWTVYDATISGWEEEHRGGVDPRKFFRRSRGPSRPYEGVALRLCPQSGNGAMFTTVKLGQLPPDLAKRCRKLDRSAAIPDWEKRDSFPILLALSPGQPSEELADPYEMRQQFFALSSDLDQLANFARKWGLWDSNKLTISHSERIPMLDRNEIPCIFPHLIQQEKAEYRNAICATSDQWLSQTKRKIHIVQRSRKPYFFVNTDLLASLESCPSAIAATITLDHLNGSQFGICSRPDCKAVFELESKHEQKYCKRACAHVMAVRAYRAKPEKVRREKRGTSSPSRVKAAARKQGGSLDVSVSV